MDDTTTDERQPIVNCHTHVFTLDCIPDGILPTPLMSLLRKGWLRRHFVRKFESGMFGENLQRAMRFARITGDLSQRQVFDVVAGYYPEDTRFVVLPMDMAIMAGGEAPTTLKQQHDELAEIAKETGGKAMPFCAVDPRREGVLDELKRCHQEHGFHGVKLYPPLGFKPWDPVLRDQIYPYCVDNNLPVMTHCSRGGLRQKGMSDSDQAAVTGPIAFQDILHDFPELRICLAHFGGEADWNDYLGKPHPGPLGQPRFRGENWLTCILDWLRQEKFPNLWTDVSYTMFNTTQNIPALNVFLQDELVAKRVLFGSDYYMAEIEAKSERQVSIELRHGIGDALFHRIAVANPVEWLTGKKAPATGNTTIGPMKKTLPAME
ncbi:MAG: amidohydrolase family protein [Pseudomonadota bacterium]